MLPLKPSFLTQPFAQNGARNTIPNTSAADSGLANLTEGFPLITEQALVNGGLPPQRKDFNGILFLLSAFAFYAQSGGLYTWQNNVDYPTPALVIYNNVAYVCKSANGPGTSAGARTPGTNATYWVTLLDYIGGASAQELQAAITDINNSMNDLEDDVKEELEDVKANVDNTLATVQSVPIGTIIMWAASAKPSPGTWLDCNGQSCAAYPKLVAVLGKNTVPNLSGMFPRCTGTQTVGDTTYTAPALLNVQGDAIRPATGSFRVWKFNKTSGIFQSSSNIGGANSKNGGGDRMWEISLDLSQAMPVDNEIRPVNVGLRFLILAA